MRTESPHQRKLEIPYWLAMLGGMPFTCLVAGLLLSMAIVMGTFTTWKDLGSPPSGAAHILEADISSVWVQAGDGRVYQLTFRPYGNGAGLEWVPVGAGDGILVSQMFPVERGATCVGLGHYVPTEPRGGRVLECVQVTASGVPDPGYGFEVYLALMTDGSLRVWEHGSGTPAVMVVGIYTVMITLAVGVIITAVYLGVFIRNKRRRKLGAGGA